MPKQTKRGQAPNVQQNKVGISLRLITKKDLEFVRMLRNENRRYFFNKNVISKKAQQEWWNNGAVGSGIYIICLKDIPIGTISERWLNNVPVGSNRWMGLFEVGNLMLDDSYRGKGYMTEALRQLTARRGFFVAHVKSNNRASLGVFERGEFWEVGSE